MDLQESSDGTNGNDDDVEYNGSPSQPHMQTAISFRHKAALQQEKDHPAGHESAVNINERRTLLCDRLARIVQAVQVKHVEANGHAGNHDQAGDQVEQAFSALRLNRLRPGSSGCNG
jgi:hypothetical protein